MRRLVSQVSPRRARASVPFSIVKVLGLARRSGARLGRDVRLCGDVWIHGGGKVEIQDRALIGAADLPVELHAEPDGEIIIGEAAEIGGGTSIEASARVVIGDGARVGRFCKVLDNDFHTMANLDHRPASQPVEIGSASTIGDRAILLPGARVKPGESVAPGTVVWGPRRASAGIRVIQPMQAESPARGVGRVIEGLRHPLNSLRVLLSWLRAFLLFRRDERSSRIRVHGSLRVERGGTLRVAARVIFAEGMIPTFLAARPGGKLSIGEGCFFNYGVTLEASVEITLGMRCKVGSMVVLRDDDGGRRLPIVIGDRVWLAHGVIVRPGVRIGSGSVVSAGSVVTEDVPDGSFVSGNPGMSRRLSR